MQSQFPYLSSLISGGPWWRKVPSQRRARSKYQAPNSCIQAPVAWGPDCATPGSDHRMLKKLPVCPQSRSAPWEATLIREKNSAPSGLSEQVEHDRGHPALAVVLVGLDPGVVVAVGNRPLADVEAQQPGAALDRPVHRRILHPGLAGQDQRDGQRQARGVHHPVAAEPPVGTRRSGGPRNRRCSARSRLPAPDAAGPA